MLTVMYLPSSCPDGDTATQTEPPSRAYSTYKGAFDVCLSILLKSGKNRIFSSQTKYKLKSIRVHLVLCFCTVSWSYFDKFCFWWNPASNYRFKIKNNITMFYQWSVHFTSGDQVKAFSTFKCLPWLRQGRADYSPSSAPSCLHWERIAV